MAVYIRLENVPNERVSSQFGPFEYAQLTYDELRIDDGKTFAEFVGGYWYLSDTRDQRRWTNVIIYSEDNNG